MLWLSFREANIRLVVAALGDFVNLDEIYNIGSMPWNANVFYADNYTLWPQVATQLISATCDSESRNYSRIGVVHLGVIPPPCTHFFNITEMGKAYGVWDLEPTPFPPRCEHNKWTTPKLVLFQYDMTF